MKLTLLLVILLVATTVSLPCSAGQFETAEIYVKERDFNRAAETFLSFAQSQPEHEDAPLALYTAARIRILAQDRPDEGKNLYRRLIDEYPENEWAFYGAMRLAEFTLEHEDSLQAAAFYEKAGQIGEKIFPPVTDAADAQFSALKRCGESYLSLRIYEKAEPYFSKLSETGIDDRRAMPEIYTKLASCQEGEGKGAEAAETYLKLIRMYPTSRQACGLCKMKEKIDPYAAFDWKPYEYFVEGYSVLRTWPSKAAEHMINTESRGASPDLVQTALRLLPWVYFYSSDFDKAKLAHKDYQKRYPNDADPYVQYFPMYLDSYKEEFEFRAFLTSVSILIAEADTTESPTPEEEYLSIAQSEGWKEVDLIPHLGVYNQLLFVDRPLSHTDLAYIRVHVKSERAQSTNLEVDNDDPWSVWLNGDSIGEFIGSPGTAPLDLASGWNEVIIKLTQKEGAMSATFRFVDEENEVEKDFVYSAEKK